MHSWVEYLSARWLSASLITICIFAFTTTAVAQPYVTDSVCPDDAHAEFHACSLEAAKTYNPPRTADGHPDMSGFWRRRGAGYESLQEHEANIDDNGGPSLVVDPANGIVPTQAWAEAKRRQNRMEYVHQNAVCRLTGVPMSMFMAGIFQFLQNADYFLVQSEEVHTARNIPIGPRDHIGEDISLWNGDSIAHWDGNTLVIDTTNQSAQSWLDQRGRFFSDEAHVEERLTLIDDNTIHYQATITDANVFTQPFTIAYPYRRNTVDGFEIWEEACFENNVLVADQLKGIGYEVYPGMTGDEARRLRAAWEVEQNIPEQSN